MTVRRRQQFLVGIVGWMIVAAFALSLANRLDYRGFFMATVFGLLVAVRVTAPVNVAPRWRHRLRFLIAAAGIALIAVVALRIRSILPAEFWRLLGGG